MHDDEKLILVPLQRAFRLIGVGNTKGYELVNQGLLELRKIGNKSTITGESLRALPDKLPKLSTTAA